MSDLPPCFCGQPATRTLCAIAYCHGCAETILAPIRERVIVREAIDGIGLRVGRDRPDHGPGFADLQCNTCGATWVGYHGDPCTWCDDALRHMQQWQAEMLLRPELPDPDDLRYDGAITAWAERLGRAVHAELITESQMVAAIGREARRVA